MGEMQKFADFVNGFLLFFLKKRQKKTLQSHIQLLAKYKLLLDVSSVGADVLFCY